MDDLMLQSSDLIDITTNAHCFAFHTADDMLESTVALPGATV